jgi:hypothetical protein
VLPRLQTHRWTCPCLCCPGFSSPPRLLAVATLMNASQCLASRCHLRRPQPAIFSTRYVTTPAPPCFSPRPSPARRGARGRYCRARCAARRSTGRLCSRGTCAHTQVGRTEVARKKTLQAGEVLSGFFLSDLYLCLLVSLFFNQYFSLFPLSQPFNHSLILSLFSSVFCISSAVFSSFLTFFHAHF